MSLVDRSHVASLPIFQGLAPDQLDDLLQEARSVRWLRNTSVFEQDEEAHSFFILLHGHLRVTKLTPDGQQVVVRYIGPGEIFGIAMAIGRATYPGTATAVVDSTALAWPSVAWPRLAARFPSLGANTLHTVGTRLQDTQTRVVEMSTEQVERRVAHAILRLANQAGRRIEAGIEIDFPISRRDIAEMTGTTLHTVSRILSGWESRGWVDGRRQRVVLRDPHQLSRLAEGTN